MYVFFRDGKLSPGLVLKTSTGIAFPGMTAPESQVKDRKVFATVA